MTVLQESHGYGQAVDVSGLLERLKRSGAQLVIDGWQARLVYPDLIPKDLLQELQRQRLLVLYWLVAHAPHHCVGCGGIPRGERYEVGWTCSQCTGPGGEDGP